MIIMKVPENTLGNSFDTFAILVPLGTEKEVAKALENACNTLLEKKGIGEKVYCVWTPNMNDESNSQMTNFNAFEIYGEKGDTYLPITMSLDGHGHVQVAGVNGKQMLVGIYVADCNYFGSTSQKTLKNITANELQNETIEEYIARNLC